MQRNEKIQTTLGLTGLGLIIIGAGLYFYNPVSMKVVTPIMLATGFVLVLVSSFTGVRGDETRLFDKRFTRYGLSTSISLILVVLLLGSAAFLTHRHHYRYDLTRIKKFSLSDQSLKIITNLKKPVEITCFFEETNEKLSEVKSLLKEYEYQSKMIHYTFIDPMTRPDMVQKFGLSREGTIVFQTGDRREDTNGTGEIDLTGTLMKLVGNRSKETLYFTEGHGELDPDSYDKYTGLNKFKDALKQQNYVVGKLSLHAEKGVPEDAAAVIIAGPKVPFLDDELALMQEYIDREGRLLVLLDPPLPDETSRRIPSLDRLLNPLGIKAEPNLVIDTASCLQQSGGAIPVIRNVGWHQITKDFRFGIVLPGTRSITPLEEKPANITVEKLAESSRLDEMLGGGSWGEFDLSLEDPRFDQGIDQVGPLIVAVAIEKRLDDARQSGPDQEQQTPTDTTDDSDEQPHKVARIVVLGDADIAANPIFDQLGNSDFLLNSISWLCQEEELISIRPKSPELERIFIDNRGWSRIIIVVFLVPVLFLGLGIYSWWRRR